MPGASTGGGLHEDGRREELWSGGSGAVRDVPRAETISGGYWRCHGFTAMRDAFDGRRLLFDRLNMSVPYIYVPDYIDIWPSHHQAGNAAPPPDRARREAQRRDRRVRRRPRLRSPMPCLPVASAVRLSVSPNRLPAVLPPPLIDSQPQALASLQCDRDVLQ